MKGSGLALVCSVGKHCRYQILEADINIENEDGELNKKLKKYSERILTFGIIIAIVTVSILTGNLLIEAYTKG